METEIYSVNFQIILLGNKYYIASGKDKYYPDTATLRLEEARANLIDLLQKKIKSI